MGTTEKPTLQQLPWTIKAPLLLGAALLFIAMMLVAARWQFLSRADHQIGVISAVDREAMQDNGEGYRISVTFRDPVHGPVTVRSSVVSSSTSWRVGDPAGVDYPAGQPQKAVIATFVDRWLAPVVLGGIAMVMLIIGGIGFWMFGRRGIRVHRAGNTIVGMSRSKGTRADVSLGDTEGAPSDAAQRR